MVIIWQVRCAEEKSKDVRDALRKRNNKGLFSKTFFAYGKQKKNLNKITERHHLLYKGYGTRAGKLRAAQRSGVNRLLILSLNQYFRSTYIIAQLRQRHRVRHNHGENLSGPSHAPLLFYTGGTICSPIPRTKRRTRPTSSSEIISFEPLVKGHWRLLVGHCHAREKNNEQLSLQVASCGDGLSSLAWPHVRVCLKRSVHTLASGPRIRELFAGLLQGLGKPRD